MKRDYEPVTTSDKDFVKGEAPKNGQLPLGSLPQMEDFRRPEPRIYKGACRVCKGDIVENIELKYVPTPGSPVIGPRSGSNYQYVSDGFYCKSCGLKYKFVNEK
jgi:hypothetical protein